MVSNDVLPIKTCEPTVSPEKLPSQRYTTNSDQPAPSPAETFMVGHSIEQRIRLKKVARLRIIGISVAVIILITFIGLIYTSYQRQMFYNSLLTKQTEIKQADFNTVCADRDSCVGRFIVWDGTVDGNPPQGSNSLTVVSTNGHAQINLIDPLTMDLHDGDKIEFDGFLTEVNILSPDVVNTGYVRKVVATAAQLAQAEKITEQKEAQDGQLHQADTGIALRCDDPHGSGGDSFYFYYGDALKEFFSIPSYGGVADRVTLSLRNSTNSTLTFDCEELDPDISAARGCSSYTLDRPGLELSANHSYSAAMAEARGSDTSTDSFKCQEMDKGEAAQILARRSQAVQK